MDHATSATLRSLVAAVIDRPAELPIVELVAVAESPAGNITVDLADRPVVVHAGPLRHPALERLTRREEEVARLVAAGYSNRQLATALFISLATVKDHVHSILTKTGFESRAQIVAGWLGSDLLG